MINIHNFIKAILNQDKKTLKTYFYKEPYNNQHCTNEHFNVEEYLIANCEYPRKWDNQFGRITIINDLIITVTQVYPKEQSSSYHVTAFIKIKDNKIMSMEEY